MSLTRLLLLAVFLPLIALVLFAGRVTYDSWTRYTGLAQANSVLQLAVAANRFSLLGLLTEGALSRDAITSGDKSKLQAARANTDQLYRNVRAAAAAIALKDTKLESLLGSLDDRIQNQARALRARIDANTAQSTDINTVLSPATATAFDITGRSGAVAGDADLSRRIFALYAALNFADGIFMQRGPIQASLQSGQLTAADLLAFSKGVTMQASFKKIFYDLAPPEIIAKYDAFQAQHGKAFEDIQAQVAANAGRPAEAAAKTRWTEISQLQRTLMIEIGRTLMDAISDEANDRMAAAWRDTLIYCAVALGVLAIVILVSRTVLRTVRDLLAGLAGTMDHLREGHYDVAIPSTGRGDEIGLMARATESFRESLVRMRAMEAEQKVAEACAAADRQAAIERDAALKISAEQKAAAERKTARQALADQFESTVGHIIQAVSTTATELEAAATTLSKTAEVTQHLSGSVATASAQASANVRSVASATEEMTTSVTEISRQVHESSEIATDAVRQARSTDARISDLSQAAGRIGDVVKLITAIAEQTNLLALNATIEAARAGEAGKGFAVVAQEVKALAGQTAKATDEISSQIAGMQTATRDSVTAIKEIGSTIGRIADISGSVAAAVEEQGAATQEISSNVQQAARGTHEVDANIADLNRGASETGTASSQVLASARSLARESNALKEEVAKFLGTVRAA